MKKRTRVSAALFLVMVMLLSLLTACGSSESDTEETVSAAAAETEDDEEAEDTEETEEAEDGAEEETEEAEEAEETADETEESAEAETESITVSYTLPLTEEPVTFSIFTSSAPSFMASYLGENNSYNDAESTAYFAELTGVTIEFIEVDMMAFTENLSLMLATGDYPDLITGLDSYSGGLTKAWDDGIIIEVTDYVENDMPAYLQHLEEMDALKEVTDDDGRMFGIYSLNSEVITDRGPIIRQDWLDELGLDTPTTYDELYEVGMAMLNAYDISYAFFISDVLNPSITFSAGYDLPAYDMTESGSHFYQVDGVVQSALVSDNFRDFLEMLNEWYDAGLISRDFFNMSSDDVKDAFAGSECAICWDNADYITEDNTTESLAASGFYARALPVALQEEGQTLHFSMNMDAAVQSGVCISTCCENVDLLIQVLDYSYTEEGALLSNYGIEGISYEFDENGDPQWTEAMTTVEDRTFRAAILPYVFAGLPTYVDVERYWSQTYDEDSLYAVELWSSADTDGAYDLPAALTFTTDESSTYAAYISDVETYASEYILKCVIGENDIESTWDEYVEKLYDMGLQTCIDMEQAAYDRYLER